MDKQGHLDRVTEMQLKFNSYVVGNSREAERAYYDGMLAESICQALDSGSTVEEISIAITV